MKKQQLPTKQLSKWIQFSQAGLQMAVTIAVFTLLGVWLDDEFQGVAPLFTVILSLVGVFVAMYSVIRQVINMSKES